MSGNGPFQMSTRQLIEHLRGGVPEKCDFCGEPAECLEPEEAGDWVCWACLDKWAAADPAKRYTLTHPDGRVIDTDLCAEDVEQTVRLVAVQHLVARHPGYVDLGDGAEVELEREGMVGEWHYHATSRVAGVESVMGWVVVEEVQTP